MRDHVSTTIIARPFMQNILLIMLITFSMQANAETIDARTSQRLNQILASDHRSPENRQRDQYRHPAETLAFFGLTDRQTVVEILPGSGWYTEILAPLLKPYGKLYEASYSDSPTATAYQIKTTTGLKTKLAVRPDLFSAVTVTTLQAPAQTEIAPPNSADLVLTFRNVHNWLDEGTADSVFAAFFKALKPGGVLGVVEHRANVGTSLAQTIKSGYVTEAEVISLAEKAGFKLAGRSEVNANPKDSKDYPEGVWTLPPTYRAVMNDRARYQAIGESDRMTLKFYKPE
jgi:predicted methyltransferase